MYKVSNFLLVVVISLLSVSTHSAAASQGGLFVNLTTDDIWAVS